MPVITVAYSTNKKKQKTFFDALVRHSRTWVGYCGPNHTKVTVRFLELDPEDPKALSHLLTTSSPPTHIHAVIHKRTDDMAAALLANDPQAAHRVAVLEQILKPRHSPESRRLPIVPFDPLDGIWRVLDRREICRAVDAAFSRPQLPYSPALTCPQKDRRLQSKEITTVPWVHIPSRKGLDAVSLAIQGNLTFPIIMKRRLACGTKSSHEMVVAYDMEGAIAAANTIFSVAEHDTSHTQPAGNTNRGSSDDDDIATDIIAQEYVVNNGGVLFKVYAIGPSVVVQPRCTIDANYKHNESGFYCFDSQKNTKGETYDFDPDTGCSKSTEAVMPSRKFASSIVSELSKELGLTLVGIDVVYNTRTKNYHVIDINFFPGYKGVGKAYDQLLQLVCNRVLERLEER